MTIFDEVNREVTRIAREEERQVSERKRAAERDFATFLERLDKLLNPDDQERLQLTVRPCPAYQLSGLATFVFDGRAYRMYYAGSAGWCFLSDDLDDPSTPHYAVTRDDFVRGLATLRRS